jgi:hypothetical protein
MTGALVLACSDRGHRFCRDAPLEQAASETGRKVIEILQLSLQTKPQK